MSSTNRLFAVVPAAGHSRRMGRPKLLLPLGEKTVIARLLDVLDRPDIAERFVVVRPDDQRLRAEVIASGATVVQPQVAPPDMRTSVSNALAEIRQRHAPSAEDGWLLTPADHPMLEPGILDRLLQRWSQSDCDILVPTFKKRRGHPVLFRWTLTDEIATIPPDKGLNWLLQLRNDDVLEVAVDDPSVVTDLDTPSDYEALKKRWNNRFA